MVDISPIYRGGGKLVVAARMLVDGGSEDGYVTFISAEAYRDIDYDPRIGKLL